MLTFLLLAKLAIARPAVVVVTQPPLVRALQLPLAARRLRHAGVSSVEVRTGLTAVRVQHVRAWDAVLVIDESVIVTHTYGPIPNYGIFLESRLSRGVRGHELVDAIVLEHKTWKRKHDAKDRYDDWNPGHGPNDINHGGKHAKYDGWVAIGDDGPGRSHSGRGNSGKSPSRGQVASNSGKGNGNGKHKGKH